MSLADEVAGAQRCLFGTAEHQCGRTAVLHILQADESPTMVCTEHAAWWINRQYADMHPICPTCGLPDTTWIYNTWEADGHCVMEGLEVDADLMAELVRISDGNELGTGGPS